jgi:hypothetical protein
MTEREAWEMHLTKAKGFAWKAGMSVLHVSRPLRIVRVEGDEFLEEPYFVLHCVDPDGGALVTIIPKDETFLNLADEVTAAYCQMAIASGLWYEAAP